MSSEKWALINSTNLEIYLNWRNLAFQIEIARKLLSVIVTTCISFADKAKENTLSEYFWRNPKFIIFYL